MRDANIPTTTASVEEVELWPGFKTAFRELWADHADMISLQYSGTPALKTDFTRTGELLVDLARVKVYSQWMLFK